MISQHVIVSIVSNRVDMRRHFSFSFVFVTTNNVIVIYWKPFVWIHSDTKETRISINQKSDISFGQVVDDRSLRKISHVCQIF